MIKTHYLKELSIEGTRKQGGEKNKKDIMKIQAWLTLYEMAHPGAGAFTDIDGDFGSATDRAVRNFQKAQGLPQNGTVDKALFDKLAAPLKLAFESTINGNNLRDLVVNTAKKHLESSPFELTIKEQDNSGPWVRSYMDGNEGTSWFWCMGFVQTIIDQACSTQGKKFTDLMPLTYSCDTVGTSALNKQILSRFDKVRQDPSIVKPGDIFLLQKSPHDWIHTGIVITVNGDVFETIEGNTNASGSHNGNAVYRKTRNFRQTKLDVVSIQSLV